MTDNEKGREPDPESVKLLCDLGVRRHDLAERTFDALNTRLAALFGFNGFLVPAATSTLADIAGAGCVACVLYAAWGVGLLTVAIVCTVGFFARPVATLPDPAAMFKNLAGSKQQEVGAQVIAELGNAWTDVSSAASRKSTCLNIGLVGVGVELLVVLVAFGLALYRAS